MLGLSFTPTFNSLEVSRVATSQTKRVTTTRAYNGHRHADPIMLAYAGHMVTHQIRCGEPAVEREQEVIRVTLISQPKVDCNEDSDDSSDDHATSSKAEARHGSDEQQVFLTSIEPRSGFHFLSGSQAFSVVVSFDSEQHRLIDKSTPGDVQVGDVVKLEAGLLGLVSGAPCGQVVPVEIIADGEATSKNVKVAHCVIKARKALIVFNTRTLPALQGFPSHITKALLLPRDHLGIWLLGLSGNYAFAASLGKDFVSQLLQHGIFVLPGNDQLFACPFPVTPFVFKLQDLQQKRSNGSKWLSCKMLRRYSKEFELSCNHDFKAHLRCCGQYHAAKGGTWINDRLISLLHEIHTDSNIPIRMYAFELWDKQTGKLAAASFGLAIGAFFHDFSMCCLIKDRRSAGSILSKAIGALLTECGVQLWYWGCKIPYMSEYEKHGAEEIPRLEYYTMLRSAMLQELVMDPCTAISSGKAAIAAKRT